MVLVAMSELPVACALMSSAGAVAKSGASSHSASNSSAKHQGSPLIKVLNMLVMMREKVRGQEKVQAESFNKAMCYCKSTEAGFQQSVREAMQKIPQVESLISEIEGTSKSLEDEVKGIAAERDEAQNAVNQAQEMRKNEHDAYLKESGDSKSNIDAIHAANCVFDPQCKAPALLAVDAPEAASLLDVPVPLPAPTPAPARLSDLLVDDSDGSDVFTSKVQLHSGGLAGEKSFMGADDGGSHVGLMKIEDSERQKWVMTKLSEGVFTIQVLGGVSGGKIYLGSDTDGKTVDLQTSEDGERQRWQISKGDGDWYTIQIQGGVQDERRYLSAGDSGMELVDHSMDDRQRFVISGMRVASPAQAKNRSEAPIGTTTLPMVTTAVPSRSMRGSMSVLQTASSRAMRVNALKSLWESGAALTQLQGVLLGGHILNGDIAKIVLDFLQSSSAANLQNANMPQIVGILKTMSETMEADLETLEENEKAAVATFHEMVKAKTQEVDVATSVMTDKTQRLNTAKMQLVDMSQDLDDTKTSHTITQTLLADLVSECEVRKADYESLVKSLDEEDQALGDAVDILKVSVPAPFGSGPKTAGANVAKSFLQVGASHNRHRETSLQEPLAQTPPSFLQLAATKGPRQVAAGLGVSGGRAKHVGGLVKGLVDKMLATMSQEQKEETFQKEECERNIASKDAHLASLKKDIESNTNLKASAKDSLAVIDKETADLRAGIETLDASIKVATDQRKEDNSMMVSNLAASQAAIELLEMAKRRLARFYDSLVQEEVARQEALALQQHKMLQRSYDDRPNKAIELIETIQADVKKEFNVMEKNEADAQKSYEENVAASTAKRKVDVKSTVMKGEKHAEVQETIVKLQKRVNGAQKAATATFNLLTELHKQCDTLIENHDEFKRQRASEAESLSRASAAVQAKNALTQRSAGRGHVQPKRTADKSARK